MTVPFVIITYVHAKLRTYVRIRMCTRTHVHTYVRTYTCGGLYDLNSDHIYLHDLRAFMLPCATPRSRVARILVRTYVRYVRVYL